MDSLYYLCIYMLWSDHLVIQPQHFFPQLPHIIGQVSQFLFLNDIINNMFLLNPTPLLKRLDNLLFHIMNFSYCLIFELRNITQYNFRIVVLHKLENLLCFYIHVFFQLVDCLYFWYCLCSLSMVL